MNRGERSTSDRQETQQDSRQNSTIPPCNRRPLQAVERGEMVSYRSWHETRRDGDLLSAVRQSS